MGLWRPAMLEEPPGRCFIVLMIADGVDVKIPEVLRFAFDEDSRTESSARSSVATAPARIS